MTFLSRLETKNNPPPQPRPLLRNHLKCNQHDGRMSVMATRMMELALTSILNPRLLLEWQSINITSEEIIPFC